MKTALQLYSVRDEVEKDFEGTLKAVPSSDMTELSLPGFTAKHPKMFGNFAKNTDLFPFPPMSA